MLDHIKEVEKPDLFIWTGDNSPHSDWTTTTDSIKGYTQTITDMIKSTFLDQDIYFYPCAGNHDTWPVDIENFNLGPGTNPIIDAMSHMWTPWIGSQAAQTML